MEKLRRFLPGIFVICIVGTLCMYFCNKLYYSGETTNEYETDSMYLCLRNFNINIEECGTQVRIKDSLEQEKITALFKNINKPMLIFRFKETNCHLCIENEFQIMRCCVSDIKNNCALLGSFEHQRELKVFMKLKGISFFSNNVSNEIFSNWPIEQYEMPYYFVLYPDMKVSNFFIPDKAYPGLTQKYLKGVKRLINRS